MRYRRSFSAAAGPALLMLAGSAHAQVGPQIEAARHIATDARLAGGFTGRDRSSSEALHRSDRPSGAAPPDALSDGVLAARGRWVLAAATPARGGLGPSQPRLFLAPDVLDLRDRQDDFRLSGNGERLEFGFKVWDGHHAMSSLARFDLATRTLEMGVKASSGLAPARTDGLPVTDWQNGTEPMFGGRPLKVQADEMAHALSIAGNRSGFVLSTDFALRSFDARGQPRWSQAAPGVAWAVNQSEDGRFVVAAFGDGTIRWYDAASGGEQLALFVHADKHWVLFTPEGFYQASPGGDALVGYRLNRPEHEEQLVDLGQLATVFFRPDLITRRLAGDETAIAAAVRASGDVRTVLAGDLPPTVTLLSPAVTESDGNYELKVRVSPARPGTPVGDVNLFVNGAAVQPKAASSAAGVVTERLALAPGQNVVSLRAMRADGKVASSEVVARANVRASQAKPVLRVLAVGISEYDEAALRSGVRFAARDAADFAQRLRGAAAGTYQSVDARVLTQRPDTGLDRIEQEIQGLVSRARPEDVVVIYLAGQGRAPGGQYHFIPADFHYDGDAAFNRGKTLSDAHLARLLRDLGAGRRLLILDTSDSGAAAEHPEAATAVKDALARLMRSTGRSILAAAAPQGKALEDGVNGHGVFTAALLEGLAGRADAHHSGVIDVDSLADYVSRRVAELTSRTPGSTVQSPWLSAAGQNFALVRHRGSPMTEATQPPDSLTTARRRP